MIINQNSEEQNKYVSKNSNLKQHLFYIDVIKVLAALMIIMIHLNANAFYRNQAAPLLAKLNYFGVYLGDLGVSLFIITSGLTLSLTKKENFSIKKFFKKRILAIYPSFWITYIVVAIIIVFILKKTIGDGHYWKIILTFLGLDGFFLYKMSSFYLVGEWYTGYMIITYLFFPFMFLYGTKKPLLTFLGLFSLTVILHLNYNSIFKVLENCNPIMRLPDFYFGMMMTLFITKNKKLHNFLRIMAIFYIVFYKFFDKLLPYEFHMVFTGISLFVILEFVITVFQMSKWSSFAKVVSYLSQYTFLAFLIHHQLIGYLYDNIPELASGNRLMKLCAFITVTVISFGYAIVILPLVKYFTNVLENQLDKILGSNKKLINNINKK